MIIFLPFILGINAISPDMARQLNSKEHPGGPVILQFQIRDYVNPHLELPHNKTCTCEGNKRCEDLFMKSHPAVCQFGFIFVISSSDDSVKYFSTTFAPLQSNGSISKRKNEWREYFAVGLPSKPRTIDIFAQHFGHVLDKTIHTMIEYNTVVHADTWVVPLKGVLPLLHPAYRTVRHRDEMMESSFEGQKIGTKMSLEAEIEFSLSLLRQSKVDESVVVSPLSVALAFAMVHAGAGGKSKDEIHATDEQLLKYYRSVGKALQKKSDVVVKLANRIFIDKSFKLNQTYLDKIKKNFESNAVNLDFKKENKCSKIVNEFVEEATVGKIKDIVKPYAAFLLINAIYFEGGWQVPFDLNFDIDFYVKKGVTKQVTFMCLEETSHDYVETDEVQVLSKNYQDTNFNFIVVLPKEKFGLADVRKKLTVEKLMELMGRLHPHLLEILIPKFKIETTMPLVAVLKTLGIKEVFTSCANLNDIAENIIISDVKQKAFIEVDDLGTKASAATAVKAEHEVCAKRDPSIYFRADHPFLYFLTHKKNIVFCGQYNG